MFMIKNNESNVCDRTTTRQTLRSCIFQILLLQLLFHWVIIFFFLRESRNIFSFFKKNQSCCDANMSIFYLNSMRHLHSICGSGHTWRLEAEWWKIKTNLKALHDTGDNNRDMPVTLYVILSVFLTFFISH